MKKFALCLAFATAFAGPALADPVDGLWKTQPGDSGGYLFVTIKECGQTICGVITSAVDKNGKPDPKYAHLGKKIIWNMVPKGNNYYGGGTVWAPDRDKKYSSNMTLKGNVLKVKGCVLGGLFCRGQDWMRAK